MRDIHRNLPDEHLRSIADGGGVICVPVLGIFLDDSPEPTLDHLVDHLEHVASVAGPEHVGLGPDFIREVYDDLTPPCCEGSPGASGLGPLTWVPGLDGPAGLPLVTEALVRRGWGDDDVRAVLSGNVRRLFRAELGRPGSPR